MADDPDKQRGEDDGRENVAAGVLSDPQITALPSTTPSSSSTCTNTTSAPSAASKKPNYYSKDLEKLPRHDRRRIEREIRKRRKPGESCCMKMNWGHTNILVTVESSLLALRSLLILLVSTSSPSCGQACMHRCTRLTTQDYTTVQH